MSDDTKPAVTPEEIEIAEKTDEAEGVAISRTANGAAVDEGAAAHGGGMGASGSAPDFGQPKNYAGVDNAGR